jgi:tetratricopeptide (TPR) repeat protein
VSAVDRLIFLTLVGVLCATTAAGDSIAVDLYEQGLQAQFEERYYSAIELYKASLQENPGYLRPMVGLAESFYALREYEEALTWTGEARIRDRNNPELVNLEARVRIAMGEIDPARALYEDVLEVYPYDLDARMGMARLEMADGRRRQAARQLEETLRLAPGNVQAMLELAVVYDRLGDRPTSERYLREALSYYSEEPDVHYRAGRLFRDRGELALAEHHLGRALELNRVHVEARLSLAELYLDMDRFEDAAGEARRVLEVSDERDVQRREMALYLLGVAHAGNDRLEEALSSFRQALRLRPDDEVVRLAAENLAMRFADETKDTREALARVHLAWGADLEERNYLTLAMAEYRRALRLDRDSVEARIRFAEAVRLQGRPFRFLTELLLLRAEPYNNSDPAVGDAIEVFQSRLEDTAASRWRGILPPLRGAEGLVDQYAVERERTTLALFTNPLDNREWHKGASVELTEALADLLVGTGAVQVNATVDRVVGSFQDAFRGARSASSDYFLIARFDENERSLSLTVQIFLTRTGALMVQREYFRTGNMRVRDLLVRAAEEIAAVFPARGTLVDRKFDRGLVDLGGRHGVEPGDRFVIVRRDGVRLASSQPGYSYDEGDVVGEAEVQLVDENVCEVSLEPRSFFDRINPQDYLLRAEPESSR